MDKKIAKIKGFLLDILYPKFCLGCGLEGVYLCQDCKAILDISQMPAYLTDKKSTKLDGLYFPLAYKERPLTRKLIHFFKYKPYYLKDLAETLSSLITDHFALSGQNLEFLRKNSILIAVPMDRKKLKERGYNQSEELAKKLSEKLFIPLISNNLIKIKTTRNQMELTKEDRLWNLTDAFSIRNSTEIKDKKIILVDDVYTTGATMYECAKILRQAGAQEVWGVVIARD